MRLIPVAPGRQFTERDFLSMQSLNLRGLACELREKALLLEAELYDLRARALSEEAARIGRAS